MADRLKRLRQRIACWWGNHVDPLEACGLAYPLRMYRCTACKRVVRHVEVGTGLIYSSRDQYLMERYGDD